MTVAVTNTGARSGKAVVQLYVKPLAATLIRPEKELKAFAKVDLAPGETRDVTLQLEYLRALPLVKLPALFGGAVSIPQIDALLAQMNATVAD